MDTTSPHGFSAHEVSFPADLRLYALLRVPLVARICYGPEPSEWEAAEIERSMQTKAQVIAETGTHGRSAPRERRTAERTIRVALWRKVAVILAIRNAEIIDPDRPRHSELLEPDPLSVTIAERGDMAQLFPLVFRWLHQGFSEGQLNKMRSAMRIKAEQMQRADSWARYLSPDGLRKLEKSHDAEALGLLWACAAIIRG